MKRKSYFFFVGWLMVSCGLSMFFVLHTNRTCDFFYKGECLACDTEKVIPVGYKENCTKCHGREAHYIEDGLMPVWLCAPASDDSVLHLEHISIKKNTPNCPPDRPLKDIAGNCYPCDTSEIVRIWHQTNDVCTKMRYILPDGLFQKSVQCPPLRDIQDAEMCFTCHGVMLGNKCLKQGQATYSFCVTNHDCEAHEWCYPFKIKGSSGHQGTCVLKAKTNWICSQTDGYDLNSAKTFCTRQNAHIPTLEEIETADEDLSTLCPTLDMWTFFNPDGVVWLESFTQEFLFTREGESEKLGGHQFYALCHKD